VTKYQEKKRKGTNTVMKALDPTLNDPIWFLKEACISSGKLSPEWFFFWFCLFVGGGGGAFL